MRQSPCAASMTARASSRVKRKGFRFGTCIPSGEVVHCSSPYCSTDVLLCQWLAPPLDSRTHFRHLEIHFGAARPNVPISGPSASPPSGDSRRSSPNSPWYRRPRSLRCDYPRGRGCWSRRSSQV
jgi:hypothetical protein